MVDKELLYSYIRDTIVDIHGEESILLYDIGAIYTENETIYCEIRFDQGEDVLSIPMNKWITYTRTKKIKKIMNG